MDGHTLTGNFNQIIGTEGLNFVTIGDLKWLQGAEFIRGGPDLILSGKDGVKILLEDYFLQPEGLDLVASNGGVFDGALVSRLAGPIAPGQVAQAGQPSVPQSIGQVDTLQGGVEVTRTTGTKVKLVKGDPIYQGDIVETFTDGSIGIIFSDDSTFSIESTSHCFYIYICD